MEERIKYAITANVPGTMCNLRCKYCYISNCVDESHLIKPQYDYPLETMIKAFSPKRLKGLAEITVISGGETLIDNTVIPFIHGLLKQGHVVTVVTNLTLNEKIDQLLDFPEQYLKRLIVKGSLHWLELKRLNKIDDYFNNMNKVLKKGASSYPFLVVSDDYMPYLDEIKQTCLDRIGAVPHCTPSMVYDEKDDIKRDGKLKTSPECTTEFVKYIDEQFNSRIFDTSVRFLDVDVKQVFCYAGEWSFGVDLRSGAMVKCHACKPEANFYKHLNKLPKLLPIGNNCQIANCALQYNFVSEGIIPEVQGLLSYGAMLDRPELINEEVRKLLDFKYTDFRKQYSKEKQEKISQKVKKKFESNNISLKNKIRLKIYNYLKKKLKKNCLIVD